MQEIVWSGISDASCIKRIINKWCRCCRPAVQFYVNEETSKESVSARKGPPARYWKVKYYGTLIMDKVNVPLNNNQQATSHARRTQQRVIVTIAGLSKGCHHFDEKNPVDTGGAPRRSETQRRTRRHATQSQSRHSNSTPQANSLPTKSMELTAASPKCNQWASTSNGIAIEVELMA